MFGFLKRARSKERTSSRVAKQRLQAMLFRDRMNLPANFMELIACDVAAAVKSYLEVDDERVSVRVSKQVFDGRPASVLEVSLPVKNAHSPDPETVRAEKTKEIVKPA